jgi:nucleotide-binding universal stress UspA family protein
MPLAKRHERKPLGSVLVPTDFSKNAARALERALLLPLAPKKARLHIVHVLPRALPAKVRAKTEAEARRALEEVVSAARAGARKRGLEALEITSALLFGDPFVEIIRSSRTVEAELIVLGRHGLRPIKDMFIGTTAERVVRKGEVPVLVVNLKVARAYSRPLLTLEHEVSARRTLEMMLQVVGPKVQSVAVVHGFSVPFEELVAPSHSAREMSTYRKECRDEAAALVKKFLTSVSELGIRWRVTLRPGDARSVILREAIRQRADLLVLGTHARSGLAHALIGSVAEWVIAAAPCDVLVARPRPFTFELP